MKTFSKEDEKKYLRFSFQNYIQHEPNVTWCANPKRACDCIILGNRDTLNAVICDDCGFEFCFKCSHPENHTPISCSLLENWKDKCMNESEV